MRSVEVCYTPNADRRVVERLTTVIAGQGVPATSREVPHGKKSVGDLPPEILLVVGAFSGRLAARRLTSCLPRGHPSSLS